MGSAPGLIVQRSGRRGGPRMPALRRPTPREIAMVEDAEGHRPPTPDPFEEDGDIVIQVTLRTLSGRQLDFKTFRLRKDSDRALGSLTAMGRRFEEREGYDYSYLLLLEGRTVNCSEKPYHKILDYAEHFRLIPVEDAPGAEFRADDLVFNLDLQQVVRQEDDSPCDDREHGEGVGQD